MPAAKERDPISKALSALTWLVETPQDVGVRELATALKVSPSSAHRILSALVEVGFARQDAANSRYSLGMEFLRLCHIATTRLPVRELAQSRMKSLADEIGETVVLGLYDRDRQEMMLSAEVLPAVPFAMRYVTMMNTWIPVYAGATGLAIMAFLPNDEIRSIIERTGLKALTDKTITEPGKLVKELRGIRSRGYYISRGQRIPDAGAIAAPIFSNRGVAIGDIVIAWSKTRPDAAREKKLATAVMKCARDVSNDLGGSAGDFDDMRDLAQLYAE